MKSNSNNVYGIAGPICSPSDLYRKSEKLPLLEVGDILSIVDAGAYFTSHTTNFSFPRPPVIMVSEGKHWVIRERESYDDKIRLDKY